MFVSVFVPVFFISMVSVFSMFFVRLIILLKSVISKEDVSVGVVPPPPPPVLGGDTQAPQSAGQVEQISAPLHVPSPQYAATPLVVLNILYAPAFSVSE